MLDELRHWVALARAGVFILWCIFKVRVLGVEAEQVNVEFMQGLSAFGFCWTCQIPSDD